MEYYDINEFKPKRWLLIVLIVVALAIVVVLADKFIEVRKENKKENNSIIDIIDDAFDNTEIEKKSFNSKFELFSGTKYGSSLSSYLDTVITNNKTNDRLISVIYEDINTSDPDEIKNLKRSFSTWDKVEVSVDYDDEGYVNRITIEMIEKDDSEEKSLQNTIHYYNISYENYSGSVYGVQVINLLDKVITNNKTNDNIITVNFGNLSGTDEETIRNIKGYFGDWDNCNVSLTYNEVGYVSVITIER